MKTPKSELKPDEIGRAISATLQAAPACQNVRDIIIVQLAKAEDDAPNWEIYEYVIADDSYLSCECKSLGADMQVGLQEQFDAIWPDDQQLDFDI